MTTTPYAKALMQIDGGPLVSGAQLVVGNNVIQLQGESNVNWQNQLWQIYEYPLGFPLPAGWTNNNGVYESSLVIPPPFTVDLAATRWGKYLLRLVVNQGLLAGIYAGPGSRQPLVDISTVLETRSPNLGLHDIAYQETNQFDAVRQWVGELKKTLRFIDAAVFGGFTAPIGSGLMTTTVSTMDIASRPVGAGFYTWAATPSSANLAALITDETGTGALVFGTAPLFKTSISLNNPGNTFKYVFTPAAIAADRALTLPLLAADDTVAVLAFAQTLTNKTLVAASNTITDTGATTGNTLVFNGTRFVKGQLDLADTDAATGVLPAANQASQTLVGDVTGTTAASVVEKIHGATVPVAGALTTGNACYVSGVSALTYSALNLAGGAGWVTGVLPVANGGTGLAAPGANGNVLTSNGTVWTSAAPTGGGGTLPKTRTRRAIAAPSTITTADDLIEQTAAAATATLPASPSDGHEYEVNNNTSGNNDVGGNGHNINVTGTATMTLGPRQSVTFTWSSTSTVWLAT